MVGSVESCLGSIITIVDGAPLGNIVDTAIQQDRIPGKDTLAIG